MTISQSDSLVSEIKYAFLRMLLEDKLITSTEFNNIWNKQGKL